MLHPSLKFDREALAEICRRYHIRELAIFGSATRDDFGPQSDVDLLVEYEPGGKPETFDKYFDLREAMGQMFCREVDIVEGRDSLINPYRRQSILHALESLYAA